MPPPMRSLRHILLLGIVFTAAAYQQYCKCLCNDNSIVQPIDRCGNCTKKFCLSQDICAAKHAESTDQAEPPDILINCFQTESLKDLVIVYGFLVVLVSLVIYGHFFN